MAAASEQSIAADLCYVGIDGGGSKTLAVIVDAHGHELGRGQAGSANQSSVGIEQALSSIRQAVEAAAKIAGCPAHFRSAWLGLAGIDRASDYEQFYPQLKPLAETVRLTNDAELLLSALQESVGLALIAGTGSIALGRDRHGTITRAGGWGYIIGDEGSGYSMGRQALQAAARASDGRGPQTALLQLILAAWQLSTPDDMIGQVYTQAGSTARIAALSTLVFTAARSGDQVARKIVQEAVEELVLAAMATFNALDFPEREVSIALAGGLLMNETDFRTRVVRRLRSRLALKQVALVEEPALSAALAARHISFEQSWSRPAEPQASDLSRLT
ncbi:BadF/BadG/BcrA/BcrD type ATPase [Ktedonosporobacter rubrisoli]|uniref:BadF/BadG/BcrA/BcrD type ATPase n=1 Tax=Ktedonosporobacter rubrisoli TaxID=2509675 RepID=A0A4P6JU14_KTERU|nr:BadF/BadG/BcrA/BcrD ATPase family protein [Ktedonosporobacter rubrisoli]QBD78800.1 BadF/BadG/BcrA/BcrD type ATPase [Ktedonosporobacter rubrisoli]